ncbi:hypothetical protein DPMN_168936 [Dreissena polymorpha]|uniref:Uncharacterized protein n=1 Tax=Dreissena polymorpha TaxID=45954 RepID=A0A9D4IZV0_DREPO|nr:hypothetical protein DPMN_168936 [Dreissena polymorpha]
MEMLPLAAIVALFAPWSLLFRPAARGHRAMCRMQQIYGYHAACLTGSLDSLANSERGKTAVVHVEVAPPEYWTLRGSCELNWGSGWE